MAAVLALALLARTASLYFSSEQRHVKSDHIVYRSPISSILVCD